MTTNPIALGRLWILRVSISCFLGLKTGLTLKGIVQPKNKMLLSFTHSQVVPKRFDFLSGVEQFFWFVHTIEVNRLQCVVWFPAFFRISSFVFHRRKKDTQVWNYMRFE